jgi:hypothetical protein
MREPDEINVRPVSMEPSPTNEEAKTEEETFTDPYTSRSKEGALQLMPMRFVLLSA